VPSAGHYSTVRTAEIIPPHPSRSKAYIPFTILRIDSNLKTLHTETISPNSFDYIDF
jgi:hypothetical protein